MNAVHPIFAQICNAVSPPAVVDQAPKCPEGMLEYEYRVNKLTLICHLEYEYADEHSITPQAAGFRLYEAYVNGGNVAEILAPDLVEKIEETAMQRMNAMSSQAKVERIDMHERSRYAY